MLPFTREQFFAVFADYNVAVWPAQWIAYLLGAAVTLAVVLRACRYRRAVAACLAALWIWTGVVYHALFFAPINRAAFVFAAAFVLQGLAFGFFGVVRDTLRFDGRRGGTFGVGSIVVVYAAVVYPLLGWATGHNYPATPVFGITPCPLTLFTFGILLCTTAPVSRWLLVIPFLWSLVGGSAAFALGVAQDWVLLASGLVVVPLILLRDVRQAPLRYAQRGL